MTDSRKNHSRCEFLFADGRRCRMRPADPTLSLCVRHLQIRQQREESARIGDEIVGADGALSTQEGVHKALGNVFANLARNRISARNAAVLGYVGQLMLGGLPSLERQIRSSTQTLLLLSKIKQQAEKSVSDAHNPKIALDHLEVTRRIMAIFSSLEAMSAQERERFWKYCDAIIGKKEGAATAKS